MKNFVLKIKGGCPLLLRGSVENIMRQAILFLAALAAIAPTLMAQTLPTAPPSGYDQSGRYPAGTVRAVTYYSPSIGSNNTMWVYTPPGYNTNQKYGVIYGYPGIGAGADTIFASWNVYANVLADNLVGQGLIQPVIIVGVDDNNGDVQADTLNVVIPYIDSHYSTYADADHRGLYGLSWGGGYTFNIGCSHLDTFHYLSPSSSAPNKAGDTTLFPNGGAEAKQKLRCLLISCGDADYLGLYSSSLNCHNFCNANGISNYWFSVPGGNHDAGSVWRPAMWNFLQLAYRHGISDSPVPRSAYAQIEAETYNLQSGGLQSETCGEGGQDMGYITNGSYIVFRNIDFGGGAVSFQARVASSGSGGNIELHLDSLTGRLVGTCAVPVTGGWQTWTTRSCPVSGATGSHDVYLKFTGGSGYLFNINWWRFYLTGGQDIGSVGVSGNANFSNSVFSVSGAGADIQGTADAFRFVNVTATGDCSIIARVASLQNIDPWSKAGLMIRDSTNANAANVFVGITPANGVTWQYRSSTGGSTATNATAGVIGPCWLKLVRIGNTFTGYYSLDGTTWSQQGTATFALASTASIGLAVSSRNTSTLCTATFDHMVAPNWPTSVPPLALAATALPASKINLTWSPSPGATAYNVKRSPNSGGPYTNLVGGLTATNYLDSNLPNDKLSYFHYVVSAIIGGNETPISAQTSAAVPWTPVDIGSVSLSGAATLTNGVLTVAASGDDIWNTADAFRFLYASVNGDFTFITRVATVQNINAWSKAGLMVRESLAANAANAFIALTPSNGVAFQYRSSTGGSSYNSTTAGLTAPYWVKLVRAGNTYTGYQSPEGVSWTQVGTATFSMSSDAVVGMAVTSHNNSSLCTAAFDNTTTPTPPPPAPASLSAIVGNAQITLNWPPSIGALSYNVKRSMTTGGPYTNIANVTTTNYTDTDVLANYGYFYVVSAVNFGGESTNSAQATARAIASPQVTISQSDTNLLFTWPLASPGFKLQWRTNLTLGDWQTITSPAGKLFSNQWQIKLPIPQDSVAIYYRLVK